MSYTDRGELKFLIDYRKYCKLLEYIRPYTEPDKFAGTNGTYLVSSVYYDTPGNRFYWEKIDGEKVRKKVRIRSYLDSKTCKPLHTILEVKKKDDRNVYKAKAEMDFSDAVTILNGPSTEKLHSKKFSVKEKTAIDDVLYLRHKFGLQPKIMVAYERQAFYDSASHNTRLTFDLNVGYRTVDLRNPDPQTSRYAIPPNLVVLEVKYKKFMPVWTMNMIRIFDLRLTTVSKYCEAMNNSLPEKDF